MLYKLRQIGDLLKFLIISQNKPLKNRQESVVHLALESFNHTYLMPTIMLSMTKRWFIKISGHITQKHREESVAHLALDSFNHTENPEKLGTMIFTLLGLLLKKMCLGPFQKGNQKINHPFNLK